VTTDNEQVTANAPAEPATSVNEPAPTAPAPEPEKPEAKHETVDRHAAIGQMELAPEITQRFKKNRELRVGDTFHYCPPTPSGEHIAKITAIEKQSDGFTTYTYEIIR